MKITILLSLSIIFFINQSQAQGGIPKRGFAVDWLVPKAASNPLILCFEKIELGINMPDSIQKAVNDFVSGSNLKDGLNPFNPEDIDVKGEFFVEDNGKWIQKQNGFAFYYEDFKRNTGSTNIEDWDWQKLKTRTPFRLRYTPNQVGKWKFFVTVKVKGKELVRLGEYTFTCDKSNNQGFVKVSDSKNYLKLGDNIFFPVGQNLPTPTCYFSKNEKGEIDFDEYGCSKCPCATVEEWCPHLKNLPMNPKAFMVYLEEIEKFKNAGGNYYRMLIFPHTYEIEYDNLGNYSSRMNVAWELDKLIEKTEQLDLKIHLNTFLGYPFTKAQYGVETWDWYSNSETDKGYCYQHELALKNPVEFLTDERAKKFFKNRIRYIYSRWGYSTSIALFELVSEINNKFPGHGKEIYKWQKEMADFIKDDLGQTNHILTTSYVGSPARGDKSYKIKDFDLITFNKHRETISRIDIQKDVQKRRKFKKPIILSEIGTGDSNIHLCDSDTEWKKDLWAMIFTGSATAGINWNNAHNYKLWEHFYAVQNYVSNINFDEFTDLINQTRKDNLVEMIAMQSADCQKTIGFIQNKTWNYHSNAQNNFCKEKVPPNEIFRTFKTLKGESNQNALVLKKLDKSASFMIEWFHPLKNEKIAMEEIQSDSKGKINLIFPDLNENLPFVVFKLYKKGESFGVVPKQIMKYKAVEKPKQELFTE